MATQTQVMVDWRGGMGFESTAQSGTLIKLDASPDHGGQDAGARPMELLLMSLAGCTGMDVISILRKKRQDVTGFQLKVDGVRSEEHPKVYTDITITYIVTGRNLDPEAVARSIELSVTKYCSVYPMLSQAATMHTKYEVHEAA